MKQITRTTKLIPLYLAALGFVGCNSKSGSNPPSPTPATTQSKTNSSITASLTVAEIYTQLRTTALSVQPEHVGISTNQSDKTLALVADWRMGEQEQATIVCLADGGASIYFSNGGGMIGGVEHEDVRAQVSVTLELVNSLMNQLEAVHDVPETPIEHMRFSRITADEKSTAVFSVSDLQQDNHPFFALGNSVQAVISLMSSKQENP